MHYTYTRLFLRATEYGRTGADRSLCSNEVVRSTAGSPSVMWELAGPSTVQQTTSLFAILQCSYERVCRSYKRAEILMSFSFSSNTFQYLCVFIQPPLHPLFQLSHIKPRTCLRDPQSTILCTSMDIN